MLCSIEKCCGCEACVAVCPKQCIKMCEDEKGFFYPKVDLSNCVKCHQCELTCPIINNDVKIKTNASILTEAYAVVCNDENIRKKSSSGGIFKPIALQILKQGGSVFGAAMSTNGHMVQHIQVENENELDLLMGAKYVQSKICNIYKKVKKDLEQGKKVLFSGTPCQVEALHSYLGTFKKDNLYTIDLICHGVPSPGVWEKYLAELMGNASYVSFRDKTYGWKEYSLKIVGTKGEQLVEKWTQNIYMQGYLEHLYCRPSCHTCEFKGLNRVSDLTLGDFWRIQDFVNTQSEDNRGTSLVFIHSQKGKALFDMLINSHIIKAIPVDAMEAARSNPMMLESIGVSKKSTAFWKRYSTIKVEDNIRRCLKRNIVRRVFGRFKHTLFYK